MRLEPLAEAHLPGMEAIVADPESLRFTRIPEPPPPGFARQWLERYEEGRRDRSRDAFAAVDDDGGFLGLALAPEFDREAAEVELGYIVLPEARGRGVVPGAIVDAQRTSTAAGWEWVRRAAEPTSVVLSPV